MKTMKRYIYTFCTVFLATQSCELVDPTEVVNPNIIQDTQIGVANSTVLYNKGMERQLALLFNEIVVIAELGSDNYVNTETFFNQAFDDLDIQFQDADINALQFDLANLREGATFGLETLQPADPAATEAQRADLLFYRGFAKLLSGELFRVLPLEANGPAVESDAHIQSAIDDLLQAESIDGANASYKLALARAYHRLGDQANAVTKAQETIDLEADFLRFVVYDAVNGPTSTIQNALYDRGNFDDLQPLPRLDFLDPKHYAISGSVDSNTALQKIEEAHLIIAEAQIADGDLDGARETLRDVLAVVEGRDVATIDETVEQRRNSEEVVTRPAASDILVAASPTDSLRAGLVIDRVAQARVPTVSGTSVTDTYLDNATTEDGLLETLYLMRQEIFIAEGRRFTDLGLKMQVSEVEFLSNDNVTEADTAPLVPAFLPANGMDSFTYDPVTMVCIITNNLNAILVQNKASELVLPFH